jgi:hypothetical protein
MEDNTVKVRAEQTIGVSGKNFYNDNKVLQCP